MDLFRILLQSIANFSLNKDLLYFSIRVYKMFPLGLYEWSGAKEHEIVNETKILIKNTK